VYISAEWWKTVIFGGKYALHVKLEYNSKLHTGTSFCVYISNDFTKLVHYGSNVIFFSGPVATGHIFFFWYLNNINI